MHRGWCHFSCNDQLKYGSGEVLPKPAPHRIVHHFTFACALRLGCTFPLSHLLKFSAAKVNLVLCLFQGSQVDIVRALATTSGQQEAELTFLKGYVQSEKYVVLRPINSFCETVLLIEAVLLNSRIKNTCS